MIPMGMWVGVPMGMGMGPYLVTHQKPLPMSTHDPYDILVGLVCGGVKFCENYIHSVQKIFLNLSKHNLPIPLKKIMGTHTHAWGYGSSWVWVRVRVKIPMGYPCRSLSGVQMGHKSSHGPSAGLRWTPPE